MPDECAANFDNFHLMVVDLGYQLGRPGLRDIVHCTWYGNLWTHLNIFRAVWGHKVLLSAMRMTGGLKEIA